MFLYRHVTALTVREAIKGNSIGVFVSGLSEVRVVNTEDVISGTFDVCIISFCIYT